jgi:hypothetical protein
MSDAPADQITDFAHLYARQVAHHSWRVLNLSKTPATVHKVDLSDLTCTCGDYTWRKETGETCKHLAMAMFESPKTVSVEEELVHDLSLVLSKLEGAAQGLTDQVETEATTTADEAMTGGSQSDETATETEEDIDLTHAADRLEAWLQGAVPAPEHVELWVGDHGDRTGIVVQPDNGEMADHEYESFKGVINSVDESEVHVGFGDDPCQTCGAQDDKFYYWVPGPAAAEVGGDG